MNFDYLKLNKDTHFVPNIGCPIGSPSTPYIYNPLFQRYDLNCILWPVEVPREGLADYLKAAVTMNMKMIVVTMPFKSEIIPFLDSVDETSRLFNSVNTIKIVDGKTHGIGMDGKGAIAALEKHHVKLTGKNVLMLGAGSITGVIGRELSQKGVKKLTIFNRSIDRANRVAEILRSNTNGMEVVAYEMDYKKLEQVAQTSDLVMQCTSLGMKNSGSDFENLDFINYLPDHACVMDVITNPAKTSILAKASEKGLKTVPGIDMLLGQVGEIMNYCFGIHVDESALAECKKNWANYMNIELE